MVVFSSNAIIRRCKPHFIETCPQPSRKSRVKVRVLKLNELYDGTHHDRGGDWHDGAHTM